MKKVIGLSSSDLETSCFTALTFMDQPYKECNCSHKIPQTPYFQTPKKLCKSSELKCHRTQPWAFQSKVHPFTARLNIFFLTDIGVNGKLLETWSQWFVCVWGCKTFRSPNWSHFLKASKHPQQLWLPSCFLRTAMKETLLKHGEMIKTSPSVSQDFPVWF